MKSTHFPIFLYLFGSSSVFSNLTRITLDFRRNHRHNRDDLDLFKILGKCLHIALGSAPALNHLSLTNTVPDLEDMEAFHACAPNLQELNLDFIELKFINNKNLVIEDMAGRFHLKDTNTGDRFVNSTTNSIKTLALTINRERTEATRLFSKLLQEWLTYINKKYDNVESFNFISDSSIDNTPPLSNIQLYENHLTAIISNMKNIRHFETSVYPLTANIINALDNKCNQGIQSTKIFKEILVEIPGSDEDDEGVDVGRISLFMRYFFKHMPCLTKLSVVRFSLRTGLHPDFLMGIIEESLQLEELDFRTLNIKYAFSGIVAMHRPSKLDVLKVHIDALDEFYDFQSIPAVKFDEADSKLMLTRKMNMVLQWNLGNRTTLKLKNLAASAKKDDEDDRLQ